MSATPLGRTGVEVSDVIPGCGSIGGVGHVSDGGFFEWSDDQVTSNGDMTATR